MIITKDDGMGNIYETEVEPGSEDYAEFMAEEFYEKGSKITKAQFKEAMEILQSNDIISEYVDRNLAAEFKDFVEDKYSRKPISEDDEFVSHEEEGE